MYLLFSQKEDGITPLFAYSDVDIPIHWHISINNILSLIPDKENIKSCFAGHYKFSDANHGTFFALVRIIDNKISGIIDIDNSRYALNDKCEILNKENTMEGRHYKILQFNGTLDLD